MIESYFERSWAWLFPLLDSFEVRIKRSKKEKEVKTQKPREELSEEALTFDINFAHSFFSRYLSERNRFQISSSSSLASTAVMMLIWMPNMRLTD
jgi:hypothetical protein